MRQLLVEGLVLGLLGAAASIAFAWIVIRSLLAIKLPLPVRDLARSRHRLRASWPLPWLPQALSGVLASLLPALKASSPNLVADLRGEAPAGRVGTRRFALRDVLVVTQVAFTAVLAGGRGAAAAQPCRIAARRRRLSHPAASRSSRSTPTWSATRPSAARSSGREALTRVRAMPGVVSAATASPTAAVPVQLQPAGTPRRQSHLRGRAARRDHRERLGLGRLRADAGAARPRRPRCRRHRSRRCAAGRADQRDHGPPLLAERERGGPHVPRCHHRQSHTASSAWSRTTRCTACSSGRRHWCTSRRSSARPATTTSWPAPLATPANCSSVIRRELLNDGAGPRLHGRLDDGAEPGDRA